MVTLDRFKRDTLSRDDLLIIPERRRIGNDDVSPRRNAQPAAVPPTPVFSAGSLLQRPHLLRYRSRRYFPSALAVRRLRMRGRETLPVLHSNNWPQPDHRAARPRRHAARLLQHLPASRLQDLRGGARQNRQSRLPLSSIDLL